MNSRVFPLTSSSINLVTDYSGKQSLQDDYNGKTFSCWFKLTTHILNLSLVHSSTALPLTRTTSCFRTCKLVKWSLSAPLLHMGSLLIKHTVLNSSILRHNCKKKKKKQNNHILLAFTSTSLYNLISPLPIFSFNLSLVLCKLNPKVSTYQNCV